MYVTCHFGLVHQSGAARSRIRK